MEGKQKYDCAHVSSAAQRIPGSPILAERSAYAKLGRINRTDDCGGEKLLVVRLATGPDGTLANRQGRKGCDTLRRSERLLRDCLAAGLVRAVCGRQSNEHCAARVCQA